MAADRIPWTDKVPNKRFLQELRTKLAQYETNLLVFLGAGLSVGAGRFQGRATFDEFGFDRHNDGQRFPSWLGLMTRMREHLRDLPELKHYMEELDLFFQDQSPLDCAELFRKQVGDPNYFAFLREQFACTPDDRMIITPSHKALARLAPKLIFTTNYDELIEIAFKDAGCDYRRSVTVAEFRSTLVSRPATHLVKLHGSIDLPQSIVLTRMDYARSQKNRIEMFRHLGERLRYTTFLFVGFSLSDPNFNLVHDDARLAMEGELPVSYVVQGSPNAIKELYLRSMGVNTISLDSWNQLPQFFNAITPIKQE